MDRKSLLVVSFLFFSAPLLASEDLDFALIFKSLIQDKSQLSGRGRSAFNTNIDRIGQVDPFLIPVYLEFLNLPESDEKTRKLTLLANRVNFLSARYNQHLADLSLQAGKDSSLEDKTCKKVMSLLGAMRIRAGKTPGLDSSSALPPSDDFFPVYLYLTGKPGLFRIPGTDYRSLVESLSLQAAKNLVDLLRVASELKTIQAEDLAYSYQENRVWAEYHNREVTLPAATFYRALAASLAPNPQTKPNL